MSEEIKHKKPTQKEELFCIEYLIDLNGTQAYKRAGYKVKNDAVARVQASKLLTKPNIQHRIEQLKAERSERVKINADWVLNEAVNVFKMATGTIPIKSSKPNKQTGKEEIYEMNRTNLREANRALEIIGKHVDVKAFDKELDFGDNTVIVVKAPNFGEQK